MKALSFLLGAAVMLNGCGKSERTATELKYRVLTAEILRAIPDEELEDAITDHADYKIGNDQEHAYKILRSMSEGFQMVCATREVEGEVNNGGFNQYFWNSSGEFRMEALRGFKLVGATEHEKLMAQAIAVYTQYEPKLKQYRDKGTLKAFSESYKDDPFNALDKQFYEMKEDLHALRVKFIRAHPDLFISQ